jgi:hypothetical protein
MSKQKEQETTKEKQVEMTDEDIYDQKMAAAPRFPKPMKCKVCIEEKQDIKTYSASAGRWRSHKKLYHAQKILDSKNKTHIHQEKNIPFRDWTCNKGHKWRERQEQGPSCDCGWPLKHDYWKNVNIIYRGGEDDDSVLDYSSDCDR